MRARAAVSPAFGRPPTPGSGRLFPPRAIGHVEARGRNIQARPRPVMVAMQARLTLQMAEPAIRKVASRVIDASTRCDFLKEKAP